jgi:hypothetical protein
MDVNGSAMRILNMASGVLSFSPDCVQDTQCGTFLLRHLTTPSGSPLVRLGMSPAVVARSFHCRMLPAPDADPPDSSHQAVSNGCG